jgi:hypothetical protein
MKDLFLQLTILILGICKLILDLFKDAFRIAQGK